MSTAAATEIDDPIQFLNSRRATVIRTYRKHPGEAMIEDGARTHMDRYAPDDPLHTELEVGLGYGVRMPVGVHRAVGGVHDFPNPGDILCSALAACADSTIRQIAGQLQVRIERLSVTVKGDVDVRGALCVSMDVPVGFQQMRVTVDLELEPNTPPRLRAKLLQAAEYCCVVLQTLRNGVPVSMKLVQSPADGVGAAAAAVEAG